MKTLKAVTFGVVLSGTYAKFNYSIKQLRYIEFQDIVTYFGEPTSLDKLASI